MGLKEYFRDWLKVIDKKVMFDILSKINKNKIEPAFSDIFKAFTLLSLDELKIVFLGQDPYPQKGVATGILFGNKENTKLSPSLEVIKEACIDYTMPHVYPVKFDTTLESWGKQGILLLNSSLTVETGKPGSHTMLWRPFTSSLLTNISKLNTGIIYVLFGNQAQTFEPYIGKYNDIIKVQHPAYYARINKDMPTSVFRDINKLMVGKYNKQIKWYYEY